jgi:hypothetical protein
MRARQGLAAGGNARGSRSEGQSSIRSLLSKTAAKARLTKALNALALAQVRSQLYHNKNS